jgi:hypothetical protein
MKTQSDDGRLHTQWSAEELAAYEAYCARRHGELRACTCGLAEAHLNRHAEDCAYLASVRAIDAGWYALVDQQRADKQWADGLTLGADR